MPTCCIRTAPYMSSQSVVDSTGHLLSTVREHKSQAEYPRMAEGALQGQRASMSSPQRNVAGCTDHWRGVFWGDGWEDS